MPVKNNNRADRGTNRKAGNGPVETLEEERTRLAKEYGIKPKTRAMVDLIESNPKISQTQAYIDTHSTVNRKAASVEASKLLAKPSVIGYRQSAVKKAKRRIVTLVDSGNESIALKASQDIIDRNEGKSIQKTENTSQVIHVSLDLGNTRIGNHYVQASQSPPNALIDTELS